ncbi:hypothetical protein QE152_g26345 [Popillia japonica]|uniref:Retroviral polymerase SH3-like domain-containing protein n=1 Tax=Popillia japonica TaxID=7064 RepID=A0AAW1JZS9_POPJA
MVHVPKANRVRLDPKSRKLIFVGYDSSVKCFRCIDPVTKKITISRDVVFFENPASTVVAEELDDSDSVRDESLGESSTNGTENINHGVVSKSNDTLESADERDDVEHTLVDDPDLEPGVTIPMPVRLRQSSRERRPVRHDDYVTYLTSECHCSSKIGWIQS